MTQKYDPKSAASIADMANKIMMNNLCKEIVLPFTWSPIFRTTHINVSFIIEPKVKSKYQFSRKWHEADLWNSGHIMDEVREWCVEQFGEQDHNPDAWSRWTNNLNSTFRFRDEIDYTLFLLRWSN